MFYNVFYSPGVLDVIWPALWTFASRQVTRRLANVHDAGSGSLHCSVICDFVILYMPMNVITLFCGSIKLHLISII